MPIHRPRRVLDRLLSRSILGTILVLAGCAVAALGLAYGLALAVSDLLISPAGPTPASNGGQFALVGVVLLAGGGIATLGGQLVGYGR